jgi:hypothetical protein
MISLPKETPKTTLAFLSPLALCLALATTTHAAPVRHGALHELWEGVPGDNVSDLTGSAKYRQPADQVRLLTRWHRHAA